jgi:hypothetical protein
MHAVVAESAAACPSCPTPAAAGSFALKHCDKDAIRRHLDALEAKRKPANAAAALAAPPPTPKPAPTPASTRAGRAATAAAAAAVVQLAAAAGKEERAGGLGGAGSSGGAPPLPTPAPAPYARGGLGSDGSLLLPGHQPGVGKGRERHRAEQKRQQAQRAQQRAAEVRLPRHCTWLTIAALKRRLQSICASGRASGCFVARQAALGVWVL